MFVKWDSMPRNHFHDKATLTSCLLLTDQATQLTYPVIRLLFPYCFPERCCNFSTSPCVDAIVECVVADLEYSVSKVTWK